MKDVSTTPNTPTTKTEDSMKTSTTSTEKAADAITNIDDKAAAATTATRNSARTVSAKKSAPPVSAPSPQVRILKVDHCPSLSGRSELTFHVGCIGEAIQLRVYQNSGKGYFNQEWIPLSGIKEVLTSREQLTAASLRPIFIGKSVNTAGFVLAVLKHLGLIEISKENRRSYCHTESVAFDTETAQLIASGVSIDVPEQAQVKAPAGKKGPVKRKAKRA